MALLTAALYAEVLVKLFREYLAGGTLSYAFPVILLAVFFFYQSRKDLVLQVAAPQSSGLWLIALACLAFLAGTLAAELFLTRISLVLLLAGFSWTFWGLPRTRVLLLPLLLLATAIPLPAIIYNALAGPVQVLLSRISSALAQILGLYLYSDGTSINVPKLSFPVGEMCAGLRALPSLWVVALLLFASRRIGPRLIALVVVSCFTMAAILGRILGTAALADRNPDLARAFFQFTSAWAVFLSGVILLGILLRLVLRGERKA